MRRILTTTFLITLLCYQGLAIADNAKFSDTKVTSWLKMFEAAVNAKNTPAVANMLSENFDYELSSTAEGVTKTQSKETFLNGLTKRDHLIEWDKGLDIHGQETGALIIQERQVKVSNKNMTLTTSLIDYFYLGEENGKTVLLRIQTEEQSDKTRMALVE